MYSALGATVHTHKFRVREGQCTLLKVVMTCKVNEALSFKWLVCVHKYTYTHIYMQYLVSDAAVSGERQATSERKYSQVNQLAATQLHEYSSARRPRTSAGTREGSSVNAGQALSKGPLAGIQDNNLPVCSD